MDHEWKPLKEVGGGQKGECDKGHVGWYTDPVLVALCGGGVGSMTRGRNSKEDPIASSLSQAS